MGLASILIHKHPSLNVLYLIPDFCSFLKLQLTGQCVHFFFQLLDKLGRLCRFQRMIIGLFLRSLMFWLVRKIAATRNWGFQNVGYVAGGAYRDDAPLLL